MTLPDPPPTDDDKPETEPSEPEDQKDSTASEEDESEGEPLTSEEADQVEASLKSNPLTSRVHSGELTMHFGEMRGYRIMTKGIYRCLNRKEYQRTEKAQREIFKWYMKRLKRIAAALIHGNPDVITEGGINDKTGLLTEAYLKLLKLLTGKFKFNNRKHFYHLAANKLRQVVKDAIRKKQRRSKLIRSRYQQKMARKGRVNPVKEIEKGDEGDLRIWKRKGKPSIDLDKAVIKYIDRWSYVEPKYLVVLLRNQWGESYRQIAEDLKIGKSTAQEWADKAKQQIRDHSREKQ